MLKFYGQVASTPHSESAGCQEKTLQFVLIIYPVGPVNGKPCGRCNPCRYTIREGMAERLPRDVVMRYRIEHLKYRFYRTSLFKFARKIKHNVLHIPPKMQAK